jgi:hypothetical protein
MTETSTVLSEAFDTATEEGSSDFSPIPAGAYTAFVKRAEVEVLKSGKGQAVRIQWEIEDGQYAGRIVFDRCIVSHESSSAMKFGRQKLKDVCDAVGFFDKLTDLTVLENKPVSIRVAIEQDKDGQYPPKNKISGKVKPLITAGPPKANGKAKQDFNDEVPF